MKKIFIATCSLLFTLCLYAQKPKPAASQYYLYDKEWKSCGLDRAVYLTREEKINDTTYRVDAYNFKGPLISVRTFRDVSKTVPHGYFSWFDKNGLIDSAGRLLNGKKHDNWLYYSDSLTVYQSEEYYHGSLTRKKGTDQLMQERLAADSTGLSPGEREAYFKGGHAAWKKYLETNAVVPDRASLFNIHGTVRVFFLVDSDGSVKDLRFYKSVECSIDQEAWRLIERSPRWQPAEQRGRNVKAYRVQPITF